MNPDNEKKVTQVPKENPWVLWNKHMRSTVYPVLKRLIFQGGRVNLQRKELVEFILSDIQSELVLRVRTPIDEIIKVLESAKQKKEMIIKELEAMPPIHWWTSKKRKVLMEQLTYNVMEVQGTIQGLEAAIQLIAETPPPKTQDEIAEEQRRLQEEKGKLVETVSELPNQVK